MNQKVFIQKSDEFINRMNEEESLGEVKESLEVKMAKTVVIN
ncbi:MAG: hypothetical protein ACOX4H_04620 [Bacillota bacterium]|jgi:hypothetical protein